MLIVPASKLGHNNRATSMESLGLTDILLNGENLFLYSGSL